MAHDEPDLSYWDWILINSSAGKDSQAMLDYVVCLCDAQGVPRSRIVVVHCDLGRVEWEGTLALAREQAEHYGLRFEVVSRPQGDLITQVYQRHAANLAKGKDHSPWPSSKSRWCTSDQKTSQVKKLITSLTDEVRNKAGWIRNADKTYSQRPARILNCLGIRAEESPARAKKVAYGPDSASNGKREVVRWLPIFDWTEEQVWDRIWDSGVRWHDAYDKGMSRLSCCFCVLGAKADLIIAAKHNPSLAQEYIAVEAKTGHAFKEPENAPAISIADIVAAAERASVPA